MATRNKIKNTASSSIHFSISNYLDIESYCDMHLPVVLCLQKIKEKCAITREKRIMQHF